MGSQPSIFIARLLVNFRILNNNIITVNSLFDTSKLHVRRLIPNEHILTVDNNSLVLVDVYFNSYHFSHSGCKVSVALVIFNVPLPRNLL